MSYADQMYDQGYASTRSAKDLIYDKGYASSGYYSMAPATAMQSSAGHYQSTPALSHGHPHMQQQQHAHIQQPQHISARRSAAHQEYKMLVNVGGVRHEVLWATLEKFPNTRLGRLQECRTEDAILSYCDYYSYEDNEYFFDKNPKIFAAVLSCYRTGKLHIPDEFCLTELVTELRYWGFDESCLDMCCQQKYRGRKILYQEMRNEVEYEMYQQYGYQVGAAGYGYEMYDERFGVGQCAIYRKFLFDSYENPRIAKTTKVLPMISILFGVLAVVAVALNSVVSIQEKDKFGNISDNLLLTRLIMVCVAWISIEYVLRLFSAPNVARFMFDCCNIIDLLGCGLYFYCLLQPYKQSEQTTGRHSINDLWKLYLMLRSWRVPSLICKLLYEPAKLRMDTATLTNFNKQFAILMLFFLVVVIKFSTAIFLAEKNDPNTQFTSIPETFWYVIATLTTAGNASIAPTTPWGKYFGALCSIVGVLFLASVITISNFARVLQNINQNRAANAQTLRPGLGPSSQGAQQTVSGFVTGQAQGYANQQLPPHMQSQMGIGAPPRLDDANSSYHHITFSDDMANTLGTIDVMVERDRKPTREPLSHTSNKVKTITFKIKLDPTTGKLTGVTSVGSKHATSGVSMSQHGVGGSQSVAQQQAMTVATHATGAHGHATTTTAGMSVSGTTANDRAYPPALV